MGPDRAPTTPPCTPTTRRGRTRASRRGRCSAPPTASCASTSPLVAIELIAAGAETRINYDAGTGQYWGSGTHESQPLETESWRKDRAGRRRRRAADAAFECFPVVGRLAELRKAVHAENDVEAALTL